MKTQILLLACLVIFTLKILGQPIIDYDGNAYDTVVIGEQTWMKQNLKVTHYNNGELIPNVADSATWANLTTGARCYFNNDSIAFDPVYGALYNWYALSNINRLCPDGWRVPTDAEWTAVENYLGGFMFAGGKMKEEGTEHWSPPNAGATNSSDFTGLPAGMRGPTNSFMVMFENGLFWSSTATGQNAWSRYLYYLNAAVDRNPTPKKLGLSIRCIKDVNVGMGNADPNIKMRLYPNPANSKLYFTCEPNQFNRLIFYNLPGEKVMEVVITEPTTIVDIGNLPIGVYLVEINGTGLITHLKLIKE